MEQLLSFLKRKKDQPKTPETEDIQFHLYKIRQAVNKWANPYQTEYHEKGKPYLPDKPVIPFESGQSLVATEAIRADRLFVPRDTDDIPNGDERQKRCFLDQKDIITVPANFPDDNSYLVLLVPQHRVVAKYEGEPFTDEHRRIDAKRGLEEYSITVLKKVGNKLAKLMTYEEGLGDSAEIVYSESGERTVKFLPFNGDDFYTKFPLNHDIKDDHKTLSKLVYIDIEAEKPLAIWRGSDARNTAAELDEVDTHLSVENIEAHYSQTVNGTVCYKFILGTPDKENAPQRDLIKKLAPVTITQKG